MTVPTAGPFTLSPVGVVRSARGEPVDDDWDAVPSRIEVSDALPPECLDGIEAFSHLEVVYLFHRVDEAAIERGARHPRGNPAWPRVGIFAQRGKDRPNRLGSTVVRLLRREGRTLQVAGLDAIDGTPVLDIKPVFTEYLPRTEVRQPPWSHEVMRGYWRRGDPGG
jgi:tRNA-Thr(GGU) m(6)t(6)A37 methyltransferase TsaA